MSLIRIPVLRRIFVTLAVLAAAGALIRGGFRWADRTHLLTLEHIRVSGNAILPTQELSALAQTWAGRSLIGVDLEQLATRFEAHPYIRAVRLSHRYPQQLDIEVLERRPLAYINITPQVLIDREGVVLPLIPQTAGTQLPTLSGFNPAPELYPPGAEALSAKVRETTHLLVELETRFPRLYHELSEITLNPGDETIFILTEKPTRINLGSGNLGYRVATLMAFSEALQGRRWLTDYATLDLRYAKQIIAREWS